MSEAVRAVAPRAGRIALCLLLGASPAAPGTGDEGGEEAAYREVETTLPKPPGPGADLARVTTAAVEATNAFRRREGLAPLRRDPLLAEAARRFAGFLAESHRLGHAADGRRPAERARAAGYRFCTVRENLGYRYASQGFTPRALASALLEGWKGSPEHRRNLLARHALDLGIGVARSERTGAYFAVQMMGRPASARIRFEVTNVGDRPLGYTVVAPAEDAPPEVIEIAPQAVHEHTRCLPATVRVEGPGPARPVEAHDGAVVRLGGAGSPSVTGASARRGPGLTRSRAAR